MLRNRTIIKGTNYLLLGVMLYMHVCSAWCAVFTGSCCTEDKDKQSVCHHGKKSAEQKGSCQNFHLSFFNAAGQFYSDKPVESVKELSFYAIEVPSFYLNPFIFVNRDLLQFNNYHPPPPIEDIRISIQSFQI